MFKMKMLAVLLSLSLVGCNFGDFSWLTGSDDQAASTLSGRLAPGQASKVRPRAQSAEFPYTVVAQSNETGILYRAETDQSGDFSIDLPAEESGNTFVVTILGPDGRTVGPVILGADGSDGVTGLKPAGDTGLGTIDLPDDPTTAPIAPGADADADLGDLLDAEVGVRLNQSGAPVGLGSVGKGTDAQNGAGPTNGLADADRDGLIDILDADNNGNGVVDEFEPGSADSGSPTDVDFRPYTTVYCDAQAASVMYSGTPAQVLQTRIDNNNIVFFLNSTGSRQIASARILESPAPAYIEQMQVSASGSGGDQDLIDWSTRGYALDEDEGGVGWRTGVTPNADVLAGDTFTVEVTFQDGTVEQYSRMFNYTFQNIPKLVRYGDGGGLSDFDVNDATINGRPDRPIPFDGTQDLVLVVNPPLDDTGAYVTGMTYSFTIFYEQSVGPGQTSQYHNIDFAATWPAGTLPFSFQGQYDVQDSTLALSAGNTYTFTLPHELFVDTVKLDGGGQGTVDRYKIDINAQHVAAKASVMLSFAKEP